MMNENKLLEIVNLVNKTWIHYSTNFYNEKLKDRVISTLKQKLENIDLVEWIHYKLIEVGDLMINEIIFNKEKENVEKINKLKNIKLTKDQYIEMNVKWVEQGSANRYSRLLIVTNDEDIKTLIKWEFEFNENWFFKNKIWDSWFNTIGWFITFYEIASTVKANEIIKEIEDDILTNWLKSKLVFRNSNKVVEVKEKEVKYPKRKNVNTKKETLTKTNNIECTISKAKNKQSEIDREQEAIILREIEKQRNSYFNETNTSTNKEIYHEKTKSWSYSKIYVLK